MVENHKLRVVMIGVVALVVAVLATAFALGGSSGTDGSAGSTSAGATSAETSGGAGSAADRTTATTPSGTSDSQSTASSITPSGAGAAAGGNEPSSPVATGSGSSAGGRVAASGVDVAAVSDDVTATKVVKTGSLSLRVARGQVQPTITRLTALTTQSGGYVSRSRTDDVLGSPTGELTLRIPAAGFDTAVTAAEKLGRVTSVTTNANDVTGRFVDLGARLTALQQTRTTYLTILGRATTIGSTLEVQQRVDDVQQQIEELQGELKLLRNQSADGTLSVDVTQAGAVVIRPHHHHAPDGLGHAWHTSVRRFNRGFYSIIGALGPLLLALLVLAFIAALGGLGYRGIRRAMG